MSKRRVLLAGLVCGIVFFIWTAVAHIVLPLGQTGVKELPNEAQVLAGMQSNIAQPGFYYFPGMGVPENASSEQRKAAQAAYGERFSKSPSGVMVYNPPTGETNPMPPIKLVAEFLNELAQAMLTVWLLASAWRLTYRSKIIMAASIGFIAAITTNVSYHIWYGFPSNYTVAQIVIEVVGFTLVGIVGGWMLRPRGGEQIASGI